MNSPSSNDPLERARSITFGYSDTEDRIWVRMLLENKTDVNFWINRRLCKAIYEAMVGLLMKPIKVEGRELSDKSLERHLKAEFYELSRSTFDPAPPPPEKKDSEGQEAQKPNWLGLCHTVSITSGPQWLMSFKNKGTDYQLALDRRSMIKVFVGLLKTCDRSGWDLPNPHEWICISG